MSHEWGNYPEDFTPKMYWGARAILERESDQPGKALYLLPDRQSFEQLDGSQRDQDAFFDWISLQALGTNIPSSLMMMLPYGLTIFALLWASARGKGRGAPAALGENIAPGA